MINFIAMYRILSYLERAMDEDEIDLEAVSAEKLGLTDNRWGAVMEMLIRGGYVSGIDIERSSDDEAALSVYEPGITMKGLEYLEQDPLMRKAGDILRALDELLS